MLCSGNETINVMLGAIEGIWSAYASSWTEDGDHGGNYEAPVLDSDVRGRSLMDHRYLIQLIERGDDEGAIREARHHLMSVPAYRTRLIPTRDHSSGRRRDDGSNTAPKESPAFGGWL